MHANHSFRGISTAYSTIPFNKNEHNFTPGAQQHAITYRPHRGTTFCLCVKSCLVLEAAIQNFDSMSEGGRFRLFTTAGAGGCFCCHGEYIERLDLVVTMDCNGEVIASFN
jgi:hypothetical protein